MMEKYGTKGEIWSNYLKRCFEHKSFFIPPSLNVSKKRARAIRLLLEDELEDALDDEAVPNGTSNEATGSSMKGDFSLQLFPLQGELLKHKSTIGKFLLS